jgi:hypothetical protein
MHAGVAGQNTGALSHKGALAYKSTGQPKSLIKSAVVMIRLIGIGRFKIKKFQRSGLKERRGMPGFIRMHNYKRRAYRVSLLRNDRHKP